MRTQSSQSPDLLTIRRTIGDCLNNVEELTHALTELAMIYYNADQAAPKGISTLLTLFSDKLRSECHILNQLRDQL